MPTLTCLCGTAINLTEIPCPHGFKLFSEDVLEELIENLKHVYDKSETKEAFEKGAFKTLHVETRGIAQIYECPNCGRLAVFRRASDGVPALWYRLEEERSNEARIKPSPLKALLNR